MLNICIIKRTFKEGNWPINKVTNFHTKNLVALDENFLEPIELMLLMPMAH